MKRLILVFACIAALCVGLHAETVMVSLLNDKGVEYFGGERTRLASALVEGAMEVFFEADHIVFDLGFPTDETDLFPDRDTAALIARAGGAAYLLDLRVGAPDGDEGPPEYLLYDFIELVNGRVLTSGIVRLSDIRETVTDPLSVCLILGEEVASGALIALK
jgi:hypothetical protein